MEVDIDLVKPSPYQPRLDFDLEDLKGTIIKDGIASPLVIRQVDTGYELIDGERRLMLAKELGYKTVPCQLVEADDEKAMRLAWRLNVERKDYTPKEKAHHFRNRQNEGMSLREIGRLFGYDHHSIMMYLNVFKLPEEYQEAVWHGDIPVGNIRELEPLFRGGERAPPEIIDWLDQRLSHEDLHKALSPTLTRYKEQQVEKAQEAVGEVAPEIPLESPEDYERAAKALKERGSRMRREAMTPEELLKEEEEKQRKKREKEEKKRQEELRLLEAETVDIIPTKEEVERARAKLRELIPEGKKTELEEVLATSDLSVGILEQLPGAIRREPDQPIIEIARQLHIDSLPGLRKSRRVSQPKPEPELDEYVNEVAKTGYKLMDLLAKLTAGNFRQIAPSFEILIISQMLFALNITVKKYREGNDG